jgi:cation diffusion facilitator CzcD-associated flavoprotein CzcO
MPAPPIVVVGAGPAGLAVAACLRRAGLESVILEQADTVGSTWRRHYDRLHLHTDKGHSALPFVPLPKGSPRYVSRDELVNYLDAYARGFALDIRLEQRVTSIERGEAGWRVRTPVDAFETTHVVVATGNARIPVVPTWPGVDDFRGRVEHCSDYRNGREYAGQRVLVVGFGNS